jgi:hypothetical protein
MNTYRGVFEPVKGLTIASRNTVIKPIDTSRRRGVHFVLKKK